MLTRYVMRGFWRKRAILQVAEGGSYEYKQGHYQLHQPWRDATAADLKILEEIKDREFHINFHDRRLPVGARVKIKSGKFSGGSYGTVVFQEPAGGKIWVERDGAGSPCYFWNDELILMDNAA